jgi:acyl-CoA thioesterase I
MKHIQAIFSGIIGVIWLWAAAGSGPVILVVGDSLSAAYGIDQTTSWVTLLQQRLHEQGYRYQLANASISGDTTSGGRSRLVAILGHYNPAIVILELGGNDGLRGLSLTEMERNLSRMIEKSYAQGAQVLLLGMRIPPNYGPAYAKKFQDVYARLAETYHTPLVPFLLEGVADKTELMQPDRIHPLAQGQRQILDNVWPKLEPMLSRQHDS